LKQAKHHVKSIFRVSLLERFALLGVWGVTVLVFSVLPQTSDSFPTTENFSNMFGSQAVAVVLTLGLLVPLTAGDFDVSVAFTLTLSTMLVAVLNVNANIPIELSVLAALGVGAFIGLVNGALTIPLGLDPFIVTLGTGTFIGGIVYWISDSNTITGISSDLVDNVIINRFLGIPVEFYYGLGLCIALWYVFEFTPLGRRLLIVGRGRSVARLSGMRVARLRWGAFVASGVISAGAGVLYAGSTGGADPSSGTQLLLPAFAAAFLGATTIVPGRFNPWGSFVAIYFLITGITGLQLLGAQSYVQNLFYGGALIIGVVLARLAGQRYSLGPGN
jgi:ribose transport system permease protein